MKNQSLNHIKDDYAHMLIVVAFLVVNFFTKMDMAPNHGLGQVPG